MVKLSVRRFGTFVEGVSVVSALIGRLSGPGIHFFPHNFIRKRSKIDAGGK